MWQRITRWSGVVCICVAIHGCSDGDPKVFPVSGKVMSNSKPVSGASITFSQEGAPRNAFGETDSEGNYRLTTYKSNDGAFPGENKITVAKPTVGVMPVTVGDFGENYGKAMMETKSKKKTNNNDIPGKYTDMKTTPLRRNVKDNGPNVIDLELVN